MPHQPNILQAAESPTLEEIKAEIAAAYQQGVKTVWHPRTKMAVLCACVTIVILHLLAPKDNENTAILFYSAELIIGVCTFGFACMIGLGNGIRKLHAALEKLTVYEGVAREIIPIWISLLPSPVNRQKGSNNIHFPLVRQGILNVLPQLTATEAEQLTEDEWDRLMYQMESSDGDVVAVVLDALHKFTPPQLKKEVSYLAKGHGAARKRPEIQQSAAALQKKLNTPKDENILLRSGSRPADKALLRPAQDDRTTSPHELLRPTLSKNGRE